MNSSLLLKPCLARESATVFEPLLLCVISTPGSDEAVLRIKLRMNFRFQGPPTSCLHQFTAFFESDSMMMWESLIRAELRDIFKARRMAKTSALFISMKGIGVENIHMNLPSWSLRTPPITAHRREGLADASTFHFNDRLGGWSQRVEALRGRWGLADMVDVFHARHDGFLSMSSEVYGNGSPHPLIHQLSLNNTRSWVWVKELFLPSKILAFLSFHNDHRMMKKVACQIFLKKTPFIGGCHCSYTSLIVWGKTHARSHILIHQCHICREKGHSMKRWSMSSIELLMHNTQEGSKLWLIFMRISLDLVFNRPSSTNHEKISIRKGTKPFHRPLMMLWLWPLSALANSMYNDFTEKVPDFDGVQTHWSVPPCRKTILFKIEVSFTHSTRSCERSSRLHERLHCQLLPSQKPHAAMVASGRVESRNSQGQTSFRGNSPTHLLCQKKVLDPSPTLLRMLWSARIFVGFDFNAALQISFHGPPLL